MYENIVSLVTPFNINNEIDFDELYKLIDFQISNKTDGILILGPESEAENLSTVEKVNIIKKCVNYISGRMKIIIEITGNNVERIIEFSKLIKDFKFDYYLISCPYYVQSNENGLVNYFTLIADNLDKPILIDYDIKRSGVLLSKDVVRKLSYHKNIIGIKVSSVDINHFIELADLTKDTFRLYCGEDYLILPSIALGYYGNINIVGNVYPKEITQIYDNFLTNIDLSRKIYFKLMKIIKDLNVEVSPIPIKYLLTIFGFSNMKVRSPLGECSKELKRKIEEDYLNL